jgi:hypothetical protein
MRASKYAKLAGRPQAGPVRVTHADGSVTVHPARTPYFRPNFVGRRPTKDQRVTRPDVQR